MKLPTWREIYQSVRVYRTSNLEALGLTERQADVLAHVLVFSGVFMERHYVEFLIMRSVVVQALSHRVRSEVLSVAA